MIMNSEPAAAENIDAPQQATTVQRRSFRLKDFEGPLDLLLYLIRRNDMSIYDIHIASITEQYLQCLRDEAEVDLDDLSDFYNLAATLLLIKSRTLLPVQDGDDGDFDDPRRDLIEKLIEYQKFRKLSGLMEQREMEVEWALERSCMQRTLPFQEKESDDVWSDLDSWDLLRAFSSMLKNFSSERILDMYEEVSVQEKIALMQELLDRKSRFSFTELITRPHSALDLACAFLAMLESVKTKMIRIQQHRLFGDIFISRAAGEVADGTAS